MIDWLTIEVETEDTEYISGGKVVSLKEDGAIEWETTKFKQVEGSYDSSVVVKSKEDPDADMPILMISGNPVKFFQGHNLFGSDNLQGLAYGFAKGVLEKLKIPYENTYIEHMMKKGYYQIKRVDCTHNYRMNSREEVRSWIRAATKYASGRHQKTSAYSEKTLYIGQNSKRITLKIYCKGDEIKAHGLSDKLPPPTGNLLKAYADNILRCEVTLRAKELKKRLLNMGMYWTDKDQVHKLVMERITAMKLPENIFLDNPLIEGLKPRQQLAYNAWATGKDLRSILSKPTFYRYRSELMPLGIDIACPSGKTKGELGVPLMDIFRKPPADVPEWATKSDAYYDPSGMKGDNQK